ncbi:glycosyltransferase family 8 protein [Paenibacillus qinlingensis]|uniref:Lipopolysaccharide biosynthesis glycosyltransferase n=1 Tax=Paenibacillus qinlingensis TaxID=1837343 RepID=A0ABU1P1G5_9BACL|nr:glycosyltransferase family 8 protein [Paenibacillus qinlingensis]MDR6553587.1 lipopolysaccharide biosynthesis glycosyltransferase [Paenibacillus qinlingensis]
MENIHIVSTIDSNYIQHFCTMLASIVKNTNYRERLIVHLIHDGLTELETDQILQCTNKLGLQICFLKIDKENFIEFDVSGHFSLAIYYRLMIPSLFDKNVEKILYLDVDIIVRKDIVELWNLELGNYSIGAVEDQDGYLRLKELGIPEDNKYFNAGVLLINLNKWRSNAIASKVAAFISNNRQKLKYHDQDALNAILYSDWIELPVTWNIQSNMYKDSDENQAIEEGELALAKENPSVVHYTTASKPWHVTSTHPFKEEYFHYLQYTPFKNFQMVDPGLKDLLQRKQKLFIFGAGILGEKLVTALQLQISGFIDNSKDKWGRMLLQKEINSPGKLLDFPKEEIGIVIVSVHHKAIEKQLASLGFQENIDFVSQL